MGILALDIALYKSYDFYSGQIRSLGALAMRKVEIGNCYCSIVDNRILFLQKCLFNSSSHLIRLLSEFLLI